MATYYENKDLKNRAGVYQIRNLVNGKIYVGSSKNLYHRCYSHFNMLKNGVHCNVHLQAAYNKYGKENFIFEVIEFIDDNNLIVPREQYYIDTLDVVNCGYNMSYSACNNNSIKGRHLSEEHKKKIGLGRTGKKHTEEAKKKMSESSKGQIPWCLGLKLSEAHKKKLSEAHKGKHLSKEHKKKIGKAMKGRKYRPETIRKMQLAQGKKVTCLESGITYLSATEAGRILKINSANISQCCLGSRNSTNNLHWVYEECYNKMTLDEIYEIINFKRSNPSCKKVLCIETNEIFRSITDAAKFVGVTRKALSNKWNRSNEKIIFLRGYHFTLCKN